MNVDQSDHRHMDRMENWQWRALGTDSVWDSLTSEAFRVPAKIQILVLTGKSSGTESRKHVEAGFSILSVIAKFAWGQD